MKKVLLIISILAIQYSQAEKLNIIDNDWQKASAQAKQEGKYLFVDAYTDWCYWCKVMDKQTFIQDDVAAFMNKHFVTVKMEMEHNYGLAIAMKYRVSSFPSYLIFNPQGKLVYELAGYMEAKRFMEVLNNALDPAKQTSYPGISDNIEIGFPEFYAKAFAENGKREYPDSLTILTYLNQQQDLYSEVNYSVISKFTGVLPAKYQQHFLDHQQRYAELYSQKAVNGIVKGMAYMKLKVAIDDSSETKLKSTLGFMDTYLKGDKEREEYKTNFSMQFYGGIGNWNKFANLVDAHIKANGYANDESINSWAWNIYEKAEDVALTPRALSWLKPVVESKPLYAYLDTYAALLYKSSRLDEAEAYAEKAIETGKKAGEKTEETEALLEKIRADRVAVAPIKSR